MDGPNESINPQAMTAEEAALMFSKLRRRRVDVAQIEADIEAGSPTDDAGQLNVLTYTAWMLKEAGRGD